MFLGSFFFFFTMKIWTILSPCLSGGDMPSNPNPQMFPQDKIIHVGATITFCCIVEEGQSFRQIKYNNTVVKTTRLSRRTYSAVVVNREPSDSSGTNVICLNNQNYLLTGSTMFAGCKTTKSSNNT